MTKAGLQVESFADVIDRQFWASVPEAAKRKILLTPEAWGIPPRNIRQLVEELIARGENIAAREILHNYVTCLHSPDAEARKKTWAGLNDLLDLYVGADGSMLKIVIQNLGDRLLREPDPELQTLLSAGFVRYTHEAGRVLHYPAVQQSLVQMQGLEREQPAIAQTLWPRVRLGISIQDFVDDALKYPEFPPGLMEVLRRMPHAIVEHVASRLQRCSRRAERERLVLLARELGQEGVSHLRKMLETRPPSEGAITVGLLSRLDPAAIVEILRRRLPEWDRPFHDQVVLQLSLGGAQERGKMLTNLLDVLDPSMLPEAVDEIGMSGDPGTASRVMQFLEETTSPSPDPYLLVKAIEALNRLRETHAGPVLRRLVEARQLFRWQQPRELRITALQALHKIDANWARTFLPHKRLHPSRAEPRPHGPRSGHALGTPAAL